MSTLPLPTIVVILLTYARTEYALRTIAALRASLHYDGDLLLYIADDGSPDEHMQAVAGAVAGLPLIGWHSERMGYGASANKAWYEALQHADLALFLEDDWECRGLDLTPYARVLTQHEDLGMIRFGHLPIDLDARTCGYDGHMYLRISWESPYCFSGNPALRHRRAREAWGAYPEGLNPGQTEVAYDSQVRTRRGPAIVWPVALGEWGAFGHIGAVKSYE